MEQLMDVFRGHIINSLSSTVSHFPKETVFNVLKCPQDLDTLMQFYAGFFFFYETDKKAFWVEKQELHCV